MPTLTRPLGSLSEDFHLSRRGLAGMVMFAGYAAAGLSAEADPIHTDEAGLVTEMVQLSSGIPAYLARPDHRGRYPAVIVVSEIFGLHEYIRDVCRRFAKLGYAAIAPAFFVRVGDPAPMPLAEMPAIIKIVQAASDKQVMGDLDATIHFLQAQDYVEPSRIAITGFCWGGRIVWLACETFPQIKAGAAWYGVLQRPKNDMTPDNPIDLVQRINAPILGLYGGADPGIPVAQIDAMRAALKAEGKPSEIVVYPYTPHGFNADYRPSYRPQQARDGWKRMLAWFKQHGVA